MKNSELIQLIKGLESFPQAAKILVMMPDGELKPPKQIAVMSDNDHEEDWVVFKI